MICEMYQYYRENVPCLVVHWTAFSCCNIKTLMRLFLELACNILLALIFSYSLTQSDGQQSKTSINIQKLATIQQTIVTAQSTRYDQKITVETEIMFMV
jgi:uncharacterized membrane protein